MFDNIVFKIKVNRQQSNQIEVGLDQGDGALDGSPLSLCRCLRDHIVAEREQCYHEFLYAWRGNQQILQAPGDQPPQEDQLTNMPRSSLAVIFDDNVVNDHTSLNHFPQLIVDRDTRKERDSEQ
jgi:hypothetical protein